MGLSLLSMRILWAVALTLPFLQCINAVSLLVPLPGAELIVGIAFQVDWKWDILPTGNHGVLDINLVKDVASTSVAARLVPGADAGSVGISATIPLGTSPGQYYLQLNVTSGPEKSSVGGPYTIIASTSSTGNSTFSSTSSNSSSPTTAGNTTGNTLPNGSTQSNNIGASSQSSQPSLAGGAVAGIVVGSIVALVKALFSRFPGLQLLYSSNNVLLLQVVHFMGIRPLAQKEKTAGCNFSQIQQTFTKFPSAPTTT